MKIDRPSRNVVRVALRVDEKLRSELRAAAARAKVSENDYIISAIRHKMISEERGRHESWMMRDAVIEVEQRLKDKVTSEIERHLRKRARREKG